MKYMRLPLLLALIMPLGVVAPVGVFSGVSAQTQLPLPRFVSIRSNEANVRTGPGLQYEIKWVLKRKAMPVEVIAEYDQWRKVRDIQSDEGWVHRSQLSNARMAIVTGETQVMRERVAETSSPVARLEVQVQGKLLECNEKVCLLDVDDYKGWVSRNHLWGVYPNETIQ